MEPMYTGLTFVLVIGRGRISETSHFPAETMRGDCVLPNLKMRADDRY